VGKIGEWLIAGVIGAVIGLILTTVFQKPLDREYDEIWLWAFPEPITFESTKVSGCSGGELGSLVQAAERQGLVVDSQVSRSLLCASWKDHAGPRRILEDIATKFENCFELDNSVNPPRIAVKDSNTSICIANVELGDANQWKPSVTPKYLCNSESPVTPKMTACTPALLRSLGFQK
jgi:hypothetical protein